MAKPFHLEIITPSKTFYRGECEIVIVPTPEGEEGFMANHAWVCALLDVGELWIREPGSSKFKAAFIAGGSTRSSRFCAGSNRNSVAPPEDGSRYGACISPDRLALALPSA